MCGVLAWVWLRGGLLTQCTYSSSLVYHTDFRDPNTPFIHSINCLSSPPLAYASLLFPWSVLFLHWTHRIVLPLTIDAIPKHRMPVITISRITTDAYPIISMPIYCHLLPDTVIICCPFELLRIQSIFVMSAWKNLRKHIK